MIREIVRYFRGPLPAHLILLRMLDSRLHLLRYDGRLALGSRGLTMVIASSTPRSLRRNSVIDEFPRSSSAWRAETGSWRSRCTPGT